MALAARSSFDGPWLGAGCVRVNPYNTEERRTLILTLTQTLTLALPLTPTLTPTLALTPSQVGAACIGGGQGIALVLKAC